MVSALFTKTAISLEPKVGHPHIIPLLKALIYLYPTMNHIPKYDTNQKKSEFKIYFSTFIFSSKISRLK